MRAEQSIIVVRRCMAVFIVVLAGSALMPWLDQAEVAFGKTDTGRYLSRMVAVPMAVAAEPAASGVTSQSVRADIRSLVDAHVALRDPGARSSAPLNPPARRNAGLDRLAGNPHSFQLQE